MYILIVDDDQRIVELVSWFLNERGYRVERATGFVEAREHLKRGAPDLMLSDIDLGSEDGREELWSLAREGIMPPTLVVSGYLNAEVLASLEGLPGLVGSLPKPFDFEVLEGRIREALASLPGTDSGTPDPEPVPGPAVPAEDEDGWIEVGPAAEGN